MEGRLYENSLYKILPQGDGRNELQRRRERRGKDVRRECESVDRGFDWSGN